MTVSVTSCVGIEDEKIQQKQLNYKHLELQTALEIANPFVSAEAGGKSLHIGEGMIINQVRTVKLEKPNTERLAHAS